ncbi:hypothetical protein GCM10007052_17760 [Halioglobus japonicus]|nr:hypothetical protein GCM10007052_17760 [Halioglobus japonicus]
MQVRTKESSQWIGVAMVLTIIGSFVAVVAYGMLTFESPNTFTAEIVGSETALFRAGGHGAAGKKYTVRLADGSEHQIVSRYSLQNESMVCLTQAAGESVPPFGSYRIRNPGPCG